MRFQCPQCNRVFELPDHAFRVRCPCNYQGQFAEVPMVTLKVKPSKRKKPGLWVRILQRLSRPEDIGLGATVKRIAAKVGGERFKRWAARISLPCGCTEREEEWNKMYPNENYFSQNE